MNREQFSLVAGILGVVTGVMVLLGISGLLGWSVFDRRTSLLSDWFLGVLKPVSYYSGAVHCGTPPP
jgi:nitrate reductase gamma subunit